MAPTLATARPPSRALCIRHNLSFLRNAPALEKTASAAHQDKRPACCPHHVRKPHNKVHTPATRVPLMAPISKTISLRTHIIVSQMPEATPACRPHFRTNNSTLRRRPLESRPCHLLPSLQQHRLLAHKHHLHPSQNMPVESIPLKTERRPTCKECRMEATRLGRLTRLSIPMASPHNYHTVYNSSSNNSNSSSECKRLDNGNIFRCKQITLQCRTDTLEWELTLQ